MLFGVVPSRERLFLFFLIYIMNNRDILYQDDLVCILKPESKRGVIVFSAYTNPKNFKICNIGLKSGKQLHKEGVKFGRVIYHPYIFFRAPFKYDGSINHTSFENEVKSLYGSSLDLNDKVFIRVDPNKTYVFSSEIRVRFQRAPDINNKLNKSKIKLSEYLKIIQDNQNYIKNGKGRLNQFNWNIFKYKVTDQKGQPNHINVNIARNSEILVSLPHLEPKYFVKCKK